MQVVGSRLDGGIEDGGTGAAEFRAKAGRFDAEFFDGVDRRENDEVGTVQEVDGVGVIVDTIEQVVVLRGTQTVGSERACRGIPSGIGLRGVDTGAELRKKREITAVQREVVDGFRVGDLTDSGALRLKKRSGCGDFDGLRNVAGFQGEILDDVNTDVYDNSFCGDRLESLEGDIDFVAADFDRRELENAVRTGGGGKTGSGPFVGEGDRSAVNHGSGLVGNGSQDGTCVHLGAKWSGDDEQSDESEQSGNSGDPTKQHPCLHAHPS
jgi:hypothetical protein